MRLNNKLITSLDALRANFNIHEIWNKLDIAVRDLSPEKIHYSSDDEIVYYSLLAHKEEAEIDSDFNVTIQGRKINVTLTTDEKNYLEKLSPHDAVAVIALYKLTNKKIDREVQKLSLENIDLQRDKIILEYGASIKISKLSSLDNTPLVSKQITVSTNQSIPSKVGNIKLNPGDSTYGVFQGNKLIALSPTQAYNHAFALSYQLNEKGKLLLRVTDRHTGIIIIEYEEVHFYTLLGDNDFIVIDGLLVRCFTNENLNNHLRRSVSLVRKPTIVSIIEDIITITYQDCSTLKIKI